MICNINPYKQVVLFFVLLIALVGVSPVNAELWFDDAANSEIIVLINQVRSNPWAEAEHLGFDVDGLRESLGSDIAEEWDSGLPALIPDERLMVAAKEHVSDMLINRYYSHLSLDGRGLEERVVAKGFYPIFLAEGMGAVVFQNVISIEEASSLILQGLFYDAFNGGREGTALLSNKVTHIGVAISGGQIEVDGVLLNVFVLVVDVARDASVPPDSVVLWGHTYRDLNGNGEYDFGEGVQAVDLGLKGLANMSFSPSSLIYKHTVSGVDGTYYFIAQPGDYSIEYRLDISGADSSLLEGISVANMGEARRVDLAIDYYEDVENEN